MEEPGGEMEVSDRRLCCEAQTDTDKKERGECNQWNKLQVSIYLNIFISNCISPWVSSLHALPACIMGATPHILEEEREKVRIVSGVSACHECVRMCACVYACQCVDVLASSFTCQVHFLSLFEHHVTAGTAGTSWMVVFPSCLWQEETV